MNLEEYHSDDTARPSYRSITTRDGNFADFANPSIGLIKDGRFGLLAPNDFDEFHNLWSR